MKTDIKVRKMAITSMFAALCLVATMIIKVPTIGTNGYVNIGDTMVLMAAWLLGGVWGAAAAGIGSGLADMLSGYPAYIPGTVVIKFLMAFVAAKVATSLQKKGINSVISYIVSSIVGEFIMIAGYFLYESIILGYGAGAVPSILGNLIQAVTCLVIALALVNTIGTKLKGLINVQ